jgi:hypothetical protein
MNTRQEQTIAKMDVSLEDMKAWQKEIRACQEATEACLESKGPTSVEIESELEHQEVPGVLKDWYVDRYLAIGCVQQLKKQTQGYGGSQTKLAATHRRMTHCAIPARCKGHGHQGPFRDSVAR